MAGLFVVGVAGLGGAFLWVTECFGDLSEQEATAAAEVLEDADAGATGEEFFAEGGVEGGVDAVGDQDEVDIGIGEEGAREVGVRAADGVVGCRLMVIEEAKDDFEDLGVSADDQDINRMNGGGVVDGRVGNWHSSA